jgi:hypothetical protein
VGRAEVDLQAADRVVQLGGVAALQADDVVAVTGGVQRLHDLRHGNQARFEGERVGAGRHLDLDQRLLGRAGPSATAALTIAGGLLLIVWPLVSA